MANSHMEGFSEGGEFKSPDSFKMYTKQLDLFNDLEDLNKKKEELQNLEANMPTESGDSFDGYKDKRTWERKMGEVRNGEVAILSRVPRVVARLAEVDARLKTWGISDEEKRELILENTSLQKETLKFPTKSPETATSKPQLETTSAFAVHDTPVYLSSIDIDLGQIEKDAKLEQDINSIKINNFTEQQQAEEKAKWIANNREEYKADESNVSSPEDPMLDPSFLRPIEGNVEPIKEIITNLRESTLPETVLTMPHPEEHGSLETVMGDASDMAPKGISIEERNLLVAKGIVAQSKMLEKMAENRKNMEKMMQEAEPKMEKVQELLKNRNEKSKEGLMALGLIGLSKGLESWKKVRPGYKIALAAVLAGAAVAGLPIFLAGGLSAITFASDAFQKEVERKVKDNEEVNKGMIAAKSILKGTVLALGTGLLLSVIGHGIGSAWDSLTSSGPEHLPVAPVMPSLPTDYIVHQGDNLTKIFSNNLLNHFPGAEGLSHLQQENVIQNLLNYAAEHPGNPALATIHQFANPDLIQPGDHINLKEIGEALKNIKMENMQTFVEHAKTLKI